MSASTAAGSAFLPEDGRRGRESGTGTRATSLLSRARILTAPIMRTAVDTLPGDLRSMAAYHLGWCEAGSSTLAGRGLGPALVIAAAEAAGCPAEGATHAAAAVELVHNFTLIHDDVMLGDLVRHGRPALWRVWGVDDAVLAGDALHSLALWTLCDGPRAALSAVARLEDAVIELCLGQHHDLASEDGLEFTLDGCLEVLRHKSAALLGCACAVGALCAGAPSEVVAAMDRFGREVGIACRIVHDMRGIWGDPARPTRPVGSDLLRRKHTLPVVAALNSPTPAGREFAEIYAADRPMDQTTAAHAAQLIERAGGKAWAQAESVRHVRAAVAMVAGPRTGDLLALAESVVNRER